VLPVPQEPGRYDRFLTLKNLIVTADGEKRFAAGERNGPVDRFGRRVPRAWASGRAPHQP
ncbi:MAG TPA: hypothetical protein VHX92_06060, partial [Rhizomicrobium sp.]|nr:hypothetical protein [Rhizomicrobium sp.]